MQWRVEKEKKNKYISVIEWLKELMGEEVIENVARDCLRHLQSESL